MRPDQSVPVTHELVDTRNLLQALWLQGVHKLVLHSMCCVMRERRPFTVRRGE